MENFPILSWIIFLPLAGIIPLLLISNNRKNLLRIVTLAVTFANFILSLFLFSWFDSSNIDFQFVEKLPWIRSVGIDYHVGVDGLSILLVLLTTFISVIAIASTWTAITEKVKGFMIAFLILETGMLGVFFALDLFLFYVFWEAMLLPMYFLIGVWGGKRRIYAAIKFVLFTVAGSLLMLLGIIFIYYQNYQYTGIHTFDLTVMLFNDIFHDR